MGTRELTRDENGTMAGEVSMSHDSFELVITVSAEDRAVQQPYTLMLVHGKGGQFTAADTDEGVSTPTPSKFCAPLL